MQHKKKVLIIDDETDLCMLLKGYLVRKNYEVHISHNLEEGIILLDVLHPAILFLDNNLSDGAGWNNAPQIAKKYPDTLLMLISAFNVTAPAMPPDAQVHILEKPIRLADLDKQFESIHI